MKILVVDDDESIRVTVKRVLESRAYGHTVVTADNAENAYDAYVNAAKEGKCFDVVLTDLAMGDNPRAGMQLVRRINIAPMAEVPKRARIILMTGSLTKDVEDEAVTIGISKILEKPVAGLILARVIEHG